MLKYVARKMIILIPKMLIISLIIFFALQALPGDAITRTIPPEQYANMTEAQINDLKESAGLNSPMLIQYFSWIGKILHGDFGYSQVNGSNIGKMLATRLPFTFELAFWALIIANILGLLMGFLAAVKKNSAIDYTCTTFSVIGISVPDFFFGIVFILIFALKLKWFPTGGRMSAGDTDFLSRIKYLVLPAACLSVSLLATLTRYTRGSMLDILNKDYIKTARSKGLSEISVNIKHGFRNALTPVMTLLVLRIPMLVSGTVVIETVFNYSAMGGTILNAISGGDMTVVMITTMICSFVVLLASFLVDILTALLDPRVRLDYGG